MRQIGAEEERVPRAEPCLAIVGLHDECAAHDGEMLERVPVVRTGALEAARRERDLVDLRRVGIAEREERTRPEAVEQRRGHGTGRRAQDVEDHVPLRDSRFAMRIFSVRSTCTTRPSCTTAVTVP